MDKKVLIYLSLLTVCASSGYTTVQAKNLTKPIQRGFISEADVTGGLIVHLGCGNGRVTA
jgi:hypothetical protein